MICVCSLPDGRGCTILKTVQILLFLFPIAIGAQSENGAAGNSTDLPAPLERPTATPVKEYRIEIEVDEEYTPAELQHKLEGYTRMKNAGRSLLTAGAIVTPVGIISLITGIGLLVNEEPAGAALYFIGGIGVSFGPPMLAAGGVLSKIGRKKQQEYERRLKLQVGCNSVQLHYCF